ncbi:hypothetical protein ElyMa_002659800 [Elysia marginata]|uniref:Uncharacterized protein n=1 Tax=Elysia marginata TaxID=1093978 RepID=A0AAV4H8L1_9GAST|nr:hypothetical protein ElyMa_002659800 [Elysia marginata]
MLPISATIAHEAEFDLTKVNIWEGTIILVWLYRVLRLRMSKFSPSAETLIATETQTFKFIVDVKSKYPEDLAESDSVAAIFDRIANSTILWNDSNMAHEYSDPNSKSGVHSVVSPVSRVKVGVGDMPPLSASPGTASGMVTFDSANSSQQARPGSANNVYRTTVIVQDLKGNHSNETISHATSKHRHRRRSRRGFTSNHHHQDMEKSKQVHSPYAIYLEEILRLAPSHRRGVHKFILDHLVASTAHEVQTCLSNVIKTTKRYTVPLRHDFINHSSQQNSLHERVLTIDTRTESFNMYLVQYLTLFQKRLSSLLSMQLSDIIRAYIPAQSKLRLQRNLRRWILDSSTPRFLYKSKSTQKSPHTPQVNHNDINRETLQHDEAQRPTGLWPPKTDYNEKLSTDLNSGRISKSGKTEDSLNLPHAQEFNTFQHEVKTMGANWNLLNELSSKANPIGAEQNLLRRSRAKRHAGDSKAQRNTGSGNGKDIDMRREMHHSRELEIAHKLHYASVFVVSVLLIMVSYDLFQ